MSLFQWIYLDSCQNAASQWISMKVNLLDPLKNKTVMTKKNKTKYIDCYIVPLFFQGLGRYATINHGQFSQVDALAFSERSIPRG